VWVTEEGNHALAAFLDAFENVGHGFDLGTMDGFWAPLHSGGAVVPFSLLVHGFMLH